MKKPLAVVGTKLDIQGDGKRLAKLTRYCKNKKYDFFPVCAVTGDGTKKLLRYLGKKVEEFKG